jgi:transposase
MELHQKVLSIESRLNQNSKNSSNPPSTDKHKPKSKPGLPKPAKPRGGQSGHEGNTLKMVSSEQADQIEELKPHRCSCGKRLLRQPMELHARRQVFDIPDPKLLVTEYQQYKCSCPECGQLNVGIFPLEVSAPVQYGAGVHSLVSVLNVKYHLSYQHIEELFEDLFDQPINASTIQSALVKADSCGKPIVEQIKSKLLESSVCHADETGLRIGTERHWLHVLCDEDYTFLYPHEKRGKQAIMDGIAKLYDYTGVLVHDCWTSYWSLSSSRHALCSPHLLRELTAQIEQGSQWAVQMHELLLKLYTEKYRQGLLITPQDAQWTAYQDICTQALEQEPPSIKNARGKAKKTKGRNLAERLQKYQTEVLRFVLENNVPFSNNQAERDLRPIKGKQKVAGCFRTWDGANRYARLASVFSSWRKQNFNVFRQLKSILIGNPFVFQSEVT